MKNSLKLSICAASIVALLGCASTTPSKKIAYSNVSIPEINTLTVSTLGEQLLNQGLGYHTDSIVIEPLDAFAADFTGGVFYNKPGTDTFESNEINTVTINNGYGQPLSQQNYIHYDRKRNQICTQSFMGSCYSTSEMEFTYQAENTFRIKPNSLQQIIEYNGKSGNTLKFTYREFSGNMARQAYTTDFTMDLSEEGNTIGYKGAIIEVIKASNSKIEYKVLRNFK